MAAAVNAPGDAFLLQLTTTAWARFEDVPADVRGRHASQLLAFITPLLKSQGFDHVELVWSGGGTLNGLPAIVADLEARRGGQSIRQRQWTAWHQGAQIVATISVGAERWLQTAPVFDRIVADLRLPADRLRPASRALAVPPPMGWPDFTTQQRAKNPRTVLALRSPAAGSFIVTVGESTYTRPEDVPPSQREVLQSAVGDNMLALLGREGYEGARVTSQGTGQLMGLPALTLEYAATRSQQGFRWRWIGTWHQQRFLGVTMQAPADRWDTNAPGFDALLADPKFHAALGAEPVAPAGGRTPPSPVLSEDAHTLYTNSWAVVIGIDRYQKPGLRLRYAVNDAQSVRSLFIEGLSGEADFAPRDGIITGTELAYWLIPRVQASSANRQTPFFGKIDGLGDFVFVSAPRR